MPTGNRAFSLMELLIVSGIIIILGALIVPAIRSAIESSRRVACLSNLKSIYTIMNAYRADNDMSWPPFKIDGSQYEGTDTWPRLLMNYGASKGIFRCPSATHVQSREWKSRELGFSWYGDYAYNRDEYGRNSQWSGAPVKNPGGAFDLSNRAKSVLMIESTVYTFGALGNPNTTPFNFERTDHGGKMNVLLADGHVEWLSKDDYWSFPVNWSQAPYLSSQLKPVPEP